MRKYLHLERLCVEAPGPVSLDRHFTDLPLELGKKELKDLVQDDVERIAELQRRLFAEDKRSLLLIFQAMDAAGKGSCIRHVMSGINPQGCQVWSFKAPSKEELDHDFLWRHMRALPERGRIGIHDRSHYEEVLVVKVHPEYLLGQRLPGIDQVSDVNADLWEARYESIRSMESHLARQGVVIMKFFLHMRPEIQKERLLERIKDPSKNWKFSIGDVEERTHWDRYMSAYEEAIGSTAAAHAPWFIVPADEQWESRAIVARLIREQMEEMDPQYPTLSEKLQVELAEGERRLMEE
ncbi:MAG: polyphosphate kinase 2 family protein [Flavobacteriales bacterium]|nr:polyphosphate kinase 2 family protein [Flavobacteriales bacterium]